MHRGTALTAGEIAFCVAYSESKVRTEMLFNPAVLQFDVYSLPVLFAGILTFLLGLLVLVREQGSPVGQRYCLFAASVGLYAFGAAVSYAVQTAAASLLWDHIAHIGVLMIPVTFLASTTIVLGESAGNRRTLRILGSLTGVLLILLWTTDWIIAGNRRYFWAWYPQYGVGGILYVVFFAVVMGFALQMYIRRYRATDDERSKTRLRHFIAAIIVGFGGALDFLPTVGFEIYAAGYIFITLFVILTGYTILRFCLVDITPELAASTVLQTMGSAVLVVDRGGIIRVANSRAHRLFGLPERSLANRPLRDISASRPEPTGLGDLEVPFRDREMSWSVPDGQPIWLSVSATILADNSGRPVGTVYVGHDVSRRKEAEEQLRHAALFDELTGLPNRKLFFDRLETMIAESRRNKTHCAVLFLDLDGFKEINDELGHLAGDELLRSVASRLRSTIRASDTVARIGGDEFVVVCGSLKQPDHAEVVARKIAASLEPEFEFAGDGRTTSQRVARIGVSVGMAVYPDDGDGPDELLAVADDRMYAAKHERRGNRAH